MNDELVYIRHQLFKEKVDSSVINDLKSMLNNYKRENSIFSEICIQAINNALMYISKNKLKSAAYEINLIHNFPFSKENFYDWDEGHFFQYELPVYFEHSEDVDIIKNMIVCIANLINKISQLKEQ